MIEKNNVIENGIIVASTERLAARLKRFRHCENCWLYFFQRFGRSLYIVNSFSMLKLSPTTRVKKFYLNETIQRTIIAMLLKNLYLASIRVCRKTIHYFVNNNSCKLKCKWHAILHSVCEMPLYETQLIVSHVK